MKISLGAKQVIYPEPVLIIATYNDDGTANAMNAAWGGISDTNEIHICLSKHKTTDNILKRKHFTVSMGDVKHVVECDYLGIVSGNKVINKLEVANFHTSKSKTIDAPIIDELPFALECELISYDSNSGHLYAKILNVVADQSILTDGKVDLNKFKPLVFDELNYAYHTIGEKVGNAFKDGKQLNKQK